MHKKEKGQILLILILVITVALAVGLAVVQRSLTDISTSTRVEQSTRAFSAAEAGIERAIQQGASLGSVELGNDASIQGVEAKDVPAPKEALEYYPPVSKEEVVHVWLADPNTLTEVYDQDSLDVYWGAIPENTSEIPAIEVAVIVKQTIGGVDSYRREVFFFDPDSTRFAENGFSPVSVSGCNQNIATGFGENRPFCYMATLTRLLESPTDRLILLRARILYSKDSHPVAVKPRGEGSFPKQGKIYTSTGVAGDTQRTVQLFKLDKVVPFYFDYAIFSAGDIRK